MIASLQVRHGPTALESLYEDVLTNYDSVARPVSDQKAAVNLEFSFELIKIFDVVSHDDNDKTLFNHANIVSKRRFPQWACGNILPSAVMIYFPGRAQLKGTYHRLW